MLLILFYFIFDQHSAAWM